MVQASFTITPTAATGYVYATEFTFINNTTAINDIEDYVWDFGDKTLLVYNVTNPTHIYNYPGTYNVSLTATTITGEASIYTQTVTVDYFVRDFVLYTQLPDKFADPGNKTEMPFKVQVTTSQINKPLIVDLFAVSSKSVPYEFTTKRWESLTPNWKFLDTNDNIVTSLEVSSVPILYDNTVVGLSGEVEFFFVDSTSTGNPSESCPLLLTCSLQTSGFNYPLDSSINLYDSYANNKTVKCGVVWLVNDLQPDFLKITSNYIEGVRPKYWQDIKIPFLITAHSNRSYRIPGSPNIDSNVIFSYPEENGFANNTPVRIDLKSIDSNNFITNKDDLFFRSFDKQGNRTGGYIFTTLTPNISTDLTTIQAFTTGFIQRDYSVQEFPYAGAVGPNPFIWFSNPQHNTLNKVTLIPFPGTCQTIKDFKDKGILIDGIAKKVSVPSLSSTTTYNYNMSGFSGIYGLAIDPRNYELIACDAELDKIYKFDTNGNILSTLNLFEYYNGFLTTLDYSTSFVNDRNSHTTFIVNFKTPPTTNKQDYIITVGGVIQSPDNYTLFANKNELTIIFNGHVPVNTPVRVRQLFNPDLASNYRYTTTFWTSAINTPQTLFSLKNLQPQNNMSSMYLVVVNGIVQSPNDYTINTIGEALLFPDFSIPANKEIIILSLPVATNLDTALPNNSYFTTFAAWTTSTPISQNTSQIYLSGTNKLLKEPAGYIITVGGVLQSPEVYTIDHLNRVIDFNTHLPTNTQISVVQTGSVHYDYNAYTPAYVSLDKDYNLWVSLFNSLSVLKFDKDFNLLFSAGPEDIPHEQITDGDFTLKPPVVETDKDNNCWVAYSHPLCSTVVKYNQNGIPIGQIFLDNYATPCDLAINVDNNVWVSNPFYVLEELTTPYNVLSGLGNIQLYDTNTSQLLDEVPNIPRPGYITLDRYNNLWFTYGIRNIGFYNVKNRELFLWKINQPSLNTDNPFDLILGPTFTNTVLLTSEVLEDYNTESELGGVATDVYNRIWVLDSRYNYAYVLSASPYFTADTLRMFKVNPDTPIGYYVDILTGKTITTTLSADSYYRSIQATGDWTGNRWYQKYITVPLLTATSLSGESSPFKVTPFIDTNAVRRVNESFNMAKSLQNLAFPENLQNYNILWNKFIPGVFGTGAPSSSEDPGQITFEKIANFIDNHSDLDTCNIEQLLSLASLTRVAASDFASFLPEELKRMLNIASVPRYRLWGVENNYPDIPKSLGEQLDISTSILSANTKIVLRSKLDNTYSLVIVPLQNNLTTYPLSTFEGYGYAQPVTSNYEFFEFKPELTNTFIENLIDWNSPYTSLSPYSSTTEFWYGDDGAIETSFNYILTKNLFLK